MKELILVTGGAGFIGSHTADALAKKGYRIRILDNLAPPVHNGKWPKYVLGKGYELLRGDVRKKSDWARALKGVSYVYHLAAYQDQRPDFSKFFHTNTVGTALLYEIIAEKNLPVKRIIFAGTQFIYGDGEYRCAHGEFKKTFMPELRPLSQLKGGVWDISCPHGRPARQMPFRENQAVNPTNAYGLSKQAAENLAFRFGRTHGIPTVVLRYSIVQGPRQSPHNLYSGAIRIFTLQSLAGKPITVFEDGAEKRDFVNIQDIVAANLLALKNKKMDFNTYNIGGGRGYGILDFAGKVKKITGSKSKIVIGGFRKTDTRHAVSDISKIKKLGWRPRFSAEYSAREYFKWYRNEFLKR